MRNGKRQKTTDEFTVSQLLDDFLHPESKPSDKSVNEMDDEDYIRMMLEKDIQRTLEREKRAHQLRRDKTPSSYKDTLDENIRKKFFPYMDERPPKKEFTAEDIFVEEILNTLVVKDVSKLASKMRQAVDFIQEELGS
ncbi:MAG: hypothetical protein ACW98U_03445 [Candidatus Thorarchaeota archaeon]|jgi:hypothetical protein